MTEGLFLVNLQSFLCEGFKIETVAKCEMSKQDRPGSCPVVSRGAS